VQQHKPILLVTLVPLYLDTAAYFFSPPDSLRRRRRRPRLSSDERGLQRVRGPPPRLHRAARLAGLPLRNGPPDAGLLQDALHGFYPDLVPRMELGDADGGGGSARGAWRGFPLRGRRRRRGGRDAAGPARGDPVPGVPGRGGRAARRHAPRPSAGLMARPARSCDARMDCMHRSGTSLHLAFHDG
ncbi:hypothetical protein PVAP13_7KG013173, partial [Panicum virgatum]